MLKISMKLAVLAAVLIVEARLSYAAPIFSENFDGLVPGGSISTTLGGFTVTHGNVDLVGPGFVPELCVSPASGNCVDLNGMNAAGELTSSTLQLGAANYILTFVLNGSQRSFQPQNSTTVSLGSWYQETFVLGWNSTATITRQIPVYNAGSAALVFHSNGASAAGSILDSVKLQLSDVPLTDGPQAAPEPATMMLFGFGLAGLAFFRKSSHR